MIKWGVSALFHDASIAVFLNNKLVFASSAERFSRIKSDKHLNKMLVAEALKYGSPDEIYWYENVTLKSLRILLCNRQLKLYFIKKYLSSLGINCNKLYFTTHHKSHLYSSLNTSNFDVNNSLGLVVDSVGEFDCLSVWDVKNKNKIKKIYSQKYPKSLGLFYSSMTDLIGLNPLDEEYILMGMSSYGKNSNYIDYLKSILYEDHSYGYKERIKNIDNKFNLAYAAQKIFENELIELVNKFLIKTGYKKILYSGGCALNCKANSLLSNLAQLWIFPNPGDSGSVVGSIGTNKIKLSNMFLGLDEKENENIQIIVKLLREGRPVGVINGRAEFGPRALGNRSILADPRNQNMKEIVNNIKGREQFRPFAPCILKEYSKDYFELNQHICYDFMQYTVRCRKPKLIPSTVHVDGSSRVQTVDQNNNFLYKILKEWNRQTKCPVLLNTSLNIKGKPIVNSYNDVKEFNENLVVI